MSESVSGESASITFEDAIVQTQTLLAAMSSATLSEVSITTTIAQLVRSIDGARGFFVTYLMDERPLADQVTPSVIQALQSSPEIVAELLIKNLAMSSAMAVYHRRQHDQAMATGSDRVQARSLRLIQALKLAIVPEKAQQLLTSTTTGQGQYQAFLDRWHYDQEQQQAIQQAMEQVLVMSSSMV
jgi:hypothetical protein